MLLGLGAFSAYPTARKLLGENRLIATIDGSAAAAAPPPAAAAAAAAEVFHTVVRVTVAPAANSNQTQTYKLLLFK